MRIAIQRRPFARTAALYAATVALAALAACAIPAPHTPPPIVSSVPATIRVGINGRVVTMPIEDYVLGTALAEVSPTGETATTVTRVFEVQAILARTFAVAHLGRHRAEGFDVCDGTHCQVYDAARLKSSRFAVDAARAVAATRGVILRYANRPAEALFHADCGGHTAAAETIWGGAPLPYLQSLADNVPTLEHRAWHLALTSEDLRHALNLDPLTAEGGRLTGISVATHDASGRAMTVQLDGERSPLVRAEELRAIVNRTFGAHGLQSTHFSLTRRTGTFVFDGVGYGHGVGLCQIGALTRARRGATAEQILSYYFPGTTLGR